MKRTEPIRIEMMPMRGTDREGRLLREGTRHLVYRGPLRIGEIEETTTVHEAGQEYGFRPGLAVTSLRDRECRYPTALLNARFRTVNSAIKAIKRSERQWLDHLPAVERQQTRRKRKATARGKAKRS